MPSTAYIKITELPGHYDDNPRVSILGPQSHGLQMGPNAYLATDTADDVIVHYGSGSTVQDIINAFNTSVRVTASYIVEKSTLQKTNLVRATNPTTSGSIRKLVTGLKAASNVSSFTFPNTQINELNNGSITITATGAGREKIYAQSSSADFQVVFNAASILGGAGSVNGIVIFNPTTVGTKTDRIRIYTTGGDEFYLSVTGTAIASAPAPTATTSSWSNNTLVISGSNFNSPTVLINEQALTVTETTPNYIKVAISQEQINSSGFISIASKSGKGFKINISVLQNDLSSSYVDGVLTINTANLLEAEISSSGVELSSVQATSQTVTAQVNSQLTASSTDAYKLTISDPSVGTIEVQAGQYSTTSSVNTNMIIVSGTNFSV